MKTVMLDGRHLTLEAVMEVAMAIRPKSAGTSSRARIMVLTIPRLRSI